MVSSLLTKFSLYIIFSLLFVILIVLGYAEFKYYQVENRNKIIAVKEVELLEKSKEIAVKDTLISNYQQNELLATAHNNRVAVIEKRTADIQKKINSIKKDEELTDEEKDVVNDIVNRFNSLWETSSNPGESRKNLSGSEMQNSTSPPD